MPQLGESLWVDELHTSWVVADGPGPIWQRAQAGNQSPLYFYLIWMVVSLWGHSIATLRFLSLAAGLGLIAASYGVARKWSRSSECGLWTALIAACNADCIFYSQEARPYALLQLATVLHADLFIRLWRRPTKGRRWAFVLGGAGLFYLHYTAALVLVAQGICLLTWSSWRRRAGPYGPRHYLADALVMVLLISPMAPHVAHIAQVRDHWARIVSGWPGLQMQATLGVLVALPVAALLLGAWWRLPRRSFRFTARPGVWAVVWWLVPWAAAAVTTWSGLASLLMVRYLVGALAGLIVFAGVSTGAFRSPHWRRWLGGCLLCGTVAAGGMVPQWLHDGRLLGARQEDWRAAVAWLTERAEAAPLPILLAAGLLEDRQLPEADSPALSNYCAFPLRGLYRVDGPAIEPIATVIPSRLNARQRQLARQHGGVWVVVRLPAIRADDFLESLGAVIEMSIQDRGRFGNVTVARLTAVPAVD